MPTVDVEYRVEELLVTVIARRLAGAGHVVVGATSPIPATAALLAEHLGKTGQAPAVRVSILGSTTHFPFTDGGRELFDIAGRGRIDVFFLSGGQIDGGANINLLGTGDYPSIDTRFPGTYGAAYLYYMVPRVILFRLEHSARVFVPKVDFISAPGTSPPEVYRPGGPDALVTGLAVMPFDRVRGQFRLESVHPGHTIDEVLERTGFSFERPAVVSETPPPDSDLLEVMRGPVRDLVGLTYPDFAQTVLNPN